MPFENMGPPPPQYLYSEPVYVDGRLAHGEQMPPPGDPYSGIEYRARAEIIADAQAAAAQAATLSDPHRLQKLQAMQATLSAKPAKESAPEQPAPAQVVGRVAPLHPFVTLHTGDTQEVIEDMYAKGYDHNAIAAELRRLRRYYEDLTGMNRQ